MHYPGLSEHPQFELAQRQLLQTSNAQSGTQITVSRRIIINDIQHDKQGLVFLVFMLCSEGVADTRPLYPFKANAFFFEKVFI